MAHSPLAATSWVREPAVSGFFYPDEPNHLEQTVRALLGQAQDIAAINAQALIVPHAGYRYSGTVAACAFKLLSDWEGACPTVYLMGPAHWQPVNGVALSTAHSFATPLGLVPVAQRHVVKLLEMDAGYCTDDDAHAPEHCLEVQLPFLQVVLSRCQIVPMLFGRQTDPEQVSHDLINHMAQEPSLLLASSDLSHGHTLDEATQIDNALLAAIETGDMDDVRQGEACGLLPILCLMHVAHHFGWRAQRLGYHTSGEINRDRASVVGYAAVLFH